MNHSAPVLRGERTTLREITPADVDELVRIRLTPEVARWWHAPDPGWPLADGEPGVTRWTVVVGDADGRDRVAGLIQAGETDDPEYWSASIDLFLDPAVHGRGLGREVVSRVRDHLIHDKGHHRLTMDPAVSNTASIRCCTACEFREVGIMRRYERDADGAGWHDGMLMEYVVEPN
jgi:aminoglycoside 6'-N-acetyltransferase